MLAETITISLELSRIRREPDLQPREVLNEDTIMQYAEDMRAGTEFPPVVVFRDDDGVYWLSQGFHRCCACEVVQRDNVVAEVRTGSRLDALWDAAGSNREFDTAGMRRSTSDKQKAIRMALEARPQLSDSEIARSLGVGHASVSRLRPHFLGEKGGDTREVTRSGRTYTMQTGAIGRKPKGGDDNGDKDDAPRHEDQPGATPQLEDLLETWQEFLIDVGNDDQIRRQAQSLNREQVERLEKICETMVERLNMISKIFEDLLAVSTPSG
jgi:hypothetical protein